VSSAAQVIVSGMLLFSSLHPGCYRLSAHICNGHRHDPPERVVAGRGALVLGQFGVVGIAVLLFPMLKRHGEALAMAHVGFRVAELAASLFYLAVPLLTIELGTGLRNGTINASASSSLGALLHAQYSVAILMIYLVTSAGGLCMSVLLHRSRLIPRPIATLGLIGYPALLAGCVLDLFNLVDVTQGIGLIALVPGGIFELVLPIWLLAKGFAFPRPS
jgi:hypothetical protein